QDSLVHEPLRPRESPHQGVLPGSATSANQADPSRETRSREVCCPLIVRHLLATGRLEPWSPSHVIAEVARSRCCSSKRQARVAYRYSPVNSGVRFSLN